MSEESKAGNKERIIEFIDSIMSKNSELLDILWIFVLSVNVTNESGYWEIKYAPRRHVKVREKVKSILPLFFKRNIKKKYELNLTEIDKCIRTFSDFYDNTPNFLDNYGEEVSLLTTLLIEKRKFLKK